MAKRNLRIVPQVIIDRLRVFDQDDVVVACAKLLLPEDIPKYSHLGLKLVSGNLVTPAPAVPDPRAGKYSKANVEGYERIRKDLPKITRSFETEAPNWRGYGTHTVSWTREVYAREF